MSHPHTRTARREVPEAAIDPLAQAGRHRLPFPLGHPAASLPDSSTALLGLLVLYGLWVLLSWLGVPESALAVPFAAGLMMLVLLDREAKAPRADPSAPGLAPVAPRQHALAPGVIPQRAWAQRSGYAGTPGHRFHQALRVLDRAGRSLELQLRLRGPAGGYLPAALSGYSGSGGELLVRHVTEPLSSDRVYLTDHWIFVPDAAFERPEGLRDPRLEAELVLMDRPRQEVLLVTTIPFWLPASNAAPAVEPLLLIPAQPLAEASCLVCGETLGAAPVACPHCETASHDECWRYLGGCATYGCAGSRTKSA